MSLRLVSLYPLSKSYSRSAEFSEDNLSPIWLAGGLSLETEQNTGDGLTGGGLLMNFFNGRNCLGD